MVVGTADTRRIHELESELRLSGLLQNLSKYEYKDAAISIVKFVVTDSRSFNSKLCSGKVTEAAHMILSRIPVCQYLPPREWTETVVQTAVEKLSKTAPKSTEHARVMEGLIAIVETLMSRASPCAFTPELSVDEPVVEAPSMEFEEEESEAEGEVTAHGVPAVTGEEATMNDDIVADEVVAREEVARGGQVPGCVEIGGFVFDPTAPMHSPGEAPAGTIECPTCRVVHPTGLDACLTCRRGVPDRQPRLTRDEQIGTEGASGRTYEGMDDDGFGGGSESLDEETESEADGAVASEAGDVPIEPFTIGALVLCKSTNSDDADVMRVISVDSTCSPPVYTVSGALGDGCNDPAEELEEEEVEHSRMALLEAAKTERLREMWDTLVSAAPADGPVKIAALKKALDAFGDDLGEGARVWFVDELCQAIDTKQESLEKMIEPDAILIDCSALKTAIRELAPCTPEGYARELATYACAILDDTLTRARQRLEKAKQKQVDPVGALVYYCDPDHSLMAERVISIDGDSYTTHDVLGSVDEVKLRSRSELTSISDATDDLESDVLDDANMLTGEAVLATACNILRSPPDGCSLEKLEAALDIVALFNSSVFVPASLERAQQLCERESAAEAFGRDAALVFTTDKPEHAGELCKVLKKAIKAKAPYVQIVSAPKDGVATCAGSLTWVGAESDLELTLGKAADDEAKREVTSYITIAEFKKAVARLCELDKKQREEGYELTLRYNSIKLVPKFDRRVERARRATPKMTREGMLEYARANPNGRSTWAVDEPPGKSLAIRTIALLALNKLIGNERYLEVGLPDVWTPRTPGKKVPLPQWLELRKADSRMNKSLCEDFGRLHRQALERCDSHDIVCVNCPTDHCRYYLVTKPGCPLSSIDNTGSEALQKEAIEMAPEHFTACRIAPRKTSSNAEIVNKMKLLLAGGDTVADTGELIPDLFNLLPVTGDASIELRGAIAEYSHSRKTDDDLGKVAVAWKAFSKAAKKEKEAPVAALEEATGEAMVEEAEEAEEAEEEVEGVEEGEDAAGSSSSGSKRKNATHTPASKRPRPATDAPQGPPPGGAGGAGSGDS